MRLGPKIYSLFIVILMTVMVANSFQYDWTARSIPLAVGVLVIIMAFIQFLKDSAPAFDQLFSRMNGRVEQKENKETDEDPEGEQWPRVFMIFLWLAVFVALLYWTSYIIAVPLFLLFFIWKVGKAGIIPSAGVAIGMAAFMYVLFDVILGARF